MTDLAAAAAARRAAPLCAHGRAGYSRSPATGASGAQTVAPTAPPPSFDDLEAVRAALVKAVSRACPGWLSGQRDDIVQDAMIRVAAALRRPGAEVRSWAFVRKVALNETLDAIARARRRREVAVPDESADAGPPPLAPPGPGAASIALGRALRECLGTVPVPRRAAVLLHLYGFSLEESAGRLARGVKQVANLRYRGLAALRECLEGKGFTP